jgi:hypothetical protein
MFGQLIVGPPGSGKTTYCVEMQRFLNMIGRKIAIINLDPSIISLLYNPTIDIIDLVTLDSVQNQFQIGPNGSMLYCFDYLVKNIDWLVNKIERLNSEFTYLLIDCPGQIELFTTHDSLVNSIKHIKHKLNLRIAAVNLVDYTLSNDISRYIAANLASLSIMLQVELPYINIMAKLDVFSQTMNEEGFSLNHFDDFDNFTNLFGKLSYSSSMSHRYIQLNDKILGLVREFCLLTLIPLETHAKKMLARILEAVDVAIGYQLSHSN